MRLERVEGRDFFLVKEAFQLQPPLKKNQLEATMHAAVVRGDSARGNTF